MVRKLCVSPRRVCMYQEFDYDVETDMDSLEDPRSACEVTLLRLVRVFLVVSTNAPTFGVFCRASILWG